MEDFLDKKPEELINLVTRDFDRAEAVLDNKKPEWTDCYRQYKSKLKTVKEGRSAVFVPYTWTIVEQMKARAADALFSRTPYVGYAGQSQDDVDAAKQMEELVFYQMKEKANLPYKFIEAVGYTLIYGTAIGLYEWRNETKTIKRKKYIKENNIIINQEISEEQVTLFDNPDITFLPIESVFVDPEATDIDSARFIITRTFRDKKYLKQMEKKGIFELPENLDNGYYSSDPLDNFRTVIDKTDSLDNGEKKKTFEILSYYTDDYIIDVLNRQHILSKRENPYYNGKKPFIRIVAFPQERSFYGDSLVRILSSMQDLLNTLKNMRIDNVNMVLNKIFLRAIGDDIIEDQLEADGSLNIYAGKVLDVQDINNSLKVLEMPDVTSSSYQEENVVKQDIMFVSAVSEQSRGIAPTKRQTAAEISMMGQSSEQVFNYIVSMIEMTGLMPVASAFLELNQQFITEPITTRIFNNENSDYEYKTYDPESIVGNLDVVSVNPRFQSAQTKDSRRQQLLELFTTFASNPVTEPYINVPKFMEQIFGSYELKDYQNLINQQSVQMAEQGIDPGVQKQLDAQAQQMNMQLQMQQQQQAMQPPMPPQGQAPMPQGNGDMPPEDIQAAMELAGQGSAGNSPVPPEEVDAQLQKLTETIAQLPAEEQAKALQELDKMGV